MSRSLSLCVTACAALLAAAPVLAADYQVPGQDLRGSYPEEWGFPSEPDPLDFEMGIRYWYSMGAHQLSAFGGDYAARDTSHILEAHVRIDDNSTASFLKGNIGYAAKIDGAYSTPETGGDRTMAGGYVAYAGADFGMLPFGTDAFHFGGFLGYQFLTDNPDMGRSTFTTSGGGGDSKTNATEIHMLKLGAAVDADLGDMFDLRAEAAFIPYASLNGTYGALYFPDFLSGGATYTQGSAGNISGRMYGASGEAMLGFHPTDNLTFRIGGRAWYLTGEATMDVVTRDVASPATEQNYITNVSGLQFFRAGLLAEITGRF